MTEEVRPSELGKALKELSEVVDGEFSVIMQKLTLDGFRALVRRSATDTGYLRSKWAVNRTGAPPNKPQKNPVASNLRGKKLELYRSPRVSTRRVKAGDKVTIYNNTEYAIYLEEGTPDQPAQPMVAPVTIMLENKAKELFREFSRRRIG